MRISGIHASSCLPAVTNLVHVVIGVLEKNLRISLELDFCDTGSSSDAFAEVLQLFLGRFVADITRYIDLAP